MRRLLVLSVLFAVRFAHAGLVNLPAESGAPVNEDDWSIPLHRCLRSVDVGVGVYDGAERCALQFALPLQAGSRILRLRALHVDEDGVAQLRMHFFVRDVATGSQHALLSGKDDEAPPGVPDAMILLPGYALQAEEAAFVLIEVLGDTRLLGFSYEYQ